MANNNGARIQHLENRLNQAEQSNRALLEDLTRLQHEMKVTVRQNAQGLSEQRESVQRLDMAIRSMVGKVQQIEPRIITTEKSMQENKAAMQQLVSHTKNVANAVSMGQKDISLRKDNSQSQIQEMKAELNQHHQAKDSLERMIMQLKQEMVQLQTDVDSQKGAMQGINQAVQMQMRMRDEPRAPTVIGDSGMSDQIRQQLENKMMETVRLIRDMEAKIDAELRRRQMTEQQISTRMSELQSMINEQFYKKSSTLQIPDKIPNGHSSSMSEGERARLAARMSEVADDVTKTVNIKEQRIREEMMIKMRDLEEMILEQQEVRMKREKTLREDFEDTLELARESQSEELRKLRDGIKKESQKHIDAIKEVDDAVGILEQQIESSNVRIDKTVSVESKARKDEMEQIADKLEDCEDRLRTGMASLQLAISSMDGTKGGDVNHIRKVMDEQLGEVREALMNNLDDIEQKTSLLTDKVTEHDKLFKNKKALPPPSDDGPKEVEVDEETSERLDKLDFSQERLRRTLEQLQNGDVSDANINAVHNKLKTMEKEWTKRMEEETGIRSNQLHNLRLQIAAVKEAGDRRQSNQSNAELENVQDSMYKHDISIKKLSEALFVVKTLFERKISNEKLNRKQNLLALKGDVAKVGVRIGDNVFIKDGERNRTNTWSLHTLIKWTTWKEKWMRVLYNDPKKKRKKKRSRSNYYRNATTNFR